MRGKVPASKSHRNHTLFVRAGIVVALAASVASVSRSEEALERREFLEGRVTMLIPKAFAPMSEEWMRLKYPSANAPSIVLSDDRGAVNVAMDHKNVRLGPSQVIELHTALERSFKNLYPSATWTRSEVVSIGGWQFALLDLYTPAIDGEVRNIMAATSLVLADKPAA